MPERHPCNGLATFAVNSCTPNPGTEPDAGRTGNTVTVNLIFENLNKMGVETGGA